MVIVYGNEVGVVNPINPSDMVAIDCVIYYPDGSYAVVGFSHSKTAEDTITYYDKNGNKYRTECYYKQEGEISLDKVKMFSYTIEENGTKITYMDDGSWQKETKEKVVRYNPDGSTAFEHTNTKINNNSDNQVKSTIDKNAATYEQCINPDFDIKKIFDDNITYGPNGEEITYDRRVVADNGDIFYKKDGETVKIVDEDRKAYTVFYRNGTDKTMVTVNSDGTYRRVEEMENNKITSTYNLDGSYSVNSMFEDQGLPCHTEKLYNSAGILIKNIKQSARGDPYGTEYYDDGSIKKETFYGGNYKEYDINGEIIEEKSDDITIKYKDGNIVSMTNEYGEKYRDYNSDGSYIEYNTWDGSKKMEVNVDGSFKCYVPYNENGRTWISEVEDAYDSNFYSENGVSQDVITCDNNQNIIEKRRIYENGDIRIVNTEGDITYNSKGDITQVREDYGVISYENAKPTKIDISNKYGGSWSTSYRKITKNHEYTFYLNEDETKIVSVQDKNGNITTFENALDYVR